MRLIEVDNLKSWIENWFDKNKYYHPYSKSENISKSELYDILDQIENVDAIPVEWIKKQIEKYATFEFHLDVDDIEARACLEYLLEDWEKENGRSE